MKRSMKLTVRRISCLIMVCALLVNSYPIQTMAAETDVQTVSSVQEAVADNQSASDNTNENKEEKPEQPDADNRDDSGDTPADKTEDGKDTSTGSGNDQTQSSTMTEQGTETATKPGTEPSEGQTTEKTTEATTEETTEETTNPTVETTTEQTTENATEVSTEETTTVTIEKIKTQMQAPLIALDDIEPVYQSGENGKVGYFEAEINGNVTLHLNVERTTTEETVNKSDLKTEESDTDDDSATESVSENCKVILEAQDADGEIIELGSKEVCVTEEQDKEISISGTKKLKMDKDGEYTVWIKVLDKDGNVIKNTYKSTQITIPEELNSHITISNFTTSEYTQVMKDGVCSGFKVPYTLTITVSIDGMGGTVSASERRSEIRACIPKINYCIKANGWSKINDSLDTDDIVTQIIANSDSKKGAVCKETTEGTFTISRAGTFKITAEASGCEDYIEKELTIDKLDRKIEYTPDKTEYIYGEEAVFTPAKDSVCTENANIKVTDTDGKEKTNAKVEYKNGSFTVFMDNSKEENSETVKVTVSFPQNSIYKEDVYETCTVTFKRADPDIKYMVYPISKNGYYNYGQDVIVYADVFKNDPWMKLSKLTAAEVDKEGNEIAEDKKQLGISINYIENNIRITNENPGNAEASKAYIRLYYKGDAVHNPKSIIVSLSYQKKEQNLKYTADESTVQVFGQDSVVITNESQNTVGDVTYFESDGKGNKIADADKKLTIVRKGKNTYQVSAKNDELDDTATCYITFMHEGDRYYKKATGTVALKYSRIENTIAYRADSTEESHEYGEKIIFRCESGVTAGGIRCYESDEKGNQIKTEKHVEIDIDETAGTVAVTGSRLTDAPCYITIEHKENNTYRASNKVTFRFDVRRITSEGSITLNEETTGFLFFKTKKMVLKVTMKTDTDTWFKEDAENIHFNLSLDSHGETRVLGTEASSCEYNAETYTATYTYVINREDIRALKEADYTLTATADVKDYYEPFSKIFDSIHVKRSGLDIELDSNQVKNGILTVEFSHDTGKLNYKIQGDSNKYVGKLTAGMKITSADSEILAISDDGSFQTLKGGTTTVTLTADDNTEYDIYEPCEKTITVVITDPEDISYTLNGLDPEEYLKKATRVAGTENWFDEEILFKAGDNNLYGEICYSTNGGETYTMVKGRSFIIRNTEIQNYKFYFCDEDKNISSKNLPDNIGYDEIDNIAIDTAAPEWNDGLSIDKKKSRHSTDKISYFPESVTLTAYTGDKPGSETSVDPASGVEKVEVYYIDQNRIEMIDVPLKDRYKDAYELVLSDDAVYGRIRFTAIDYLGHRSGTAEYDKSICIDKVIPVIGYKTQNHNGEQISYNGEWTNQQLQYVLDLLTGTQVSGIYSYEYAFVAVDNKLSENTKWTSVSEDDLRLVFGTVLEQSQDTRDGVMQYGGELQESKVDEGLTAKELARYAKMNGTLYFRAESNAGLQTQNEDIDKNCSRIRIWQQQLSAANVVSDIAPDPSTGWYNKQTGSVRISFAYPEYDADSFAPAAGIVYTFETEDENRNKSTDTRSFYRGILDEESGKVVEVSDYHNTGSFTSLEAGTINIDKDSINWLSVYAEDAAGNRSAVTEYKIQADYQSPDQITATADGSTMTVHPDAAEGIAYKIFSQTSVQVSGEAQYGISEKKSFHMALTKEQGGTTSVSGDASMDSISVEPCSRGFVYICAIDGAGNKSEAWTDGIVADNLAPTGDHQQDITITPRGKNDAEFYNKDIEVSVNVVDAPTDDNYAGLKSVTYSVGKDSGITKSDMSLYSNDSTTLTLDQIVSSSSFKDDKLVIDAAANESNHAYITVTAVDHAGNSRTSTQELKIDVTKPEIEISFDTDAAQNEKYYNTSRTARIDIRELNFDPNRITFRIYKNGVEDTSLIPAASGWSSDANSIIHTAYITFAEDGDYSFEVECTDLADNESETASTDTFTIDKTRPEIEVSYDNNQAWKENYYNQARTAAISITEHNFDEKNFEAAITPQASVGGWTHNGDVHKVTIHFSQDEHYTYSVKYTDLAGNEADTFTPEEFYIDSSAPTIEINGVTDHSANAGDVNPTVTVADDNYDADGVKITLSDSKGQSIGLNRSQTGNENSHTYALTNVNGQPDEIYTLAVSAIDKAGNESELSYRFALNRHGSVYDLSQISSLVDKVYICYEDLEDLHIQEMNVSKVDEFEVYVTRNGEMIQSEQSNSRPSSRDNNTIYVGTRVNGSEEIGYEYDYTLYRESFRQEGIYNIMFYSRDAAGNEVNNTLTEKKAELTFIIDNTAPTVVVEGVEDGELYIEEARDVNVYVSDNFKLTEAYFTLVDEDGNTIDTYNYMELAKEAGDIVTLTLPSSDRKQSLRYYAADAAGNNIVTLEDENAATGFTISTNTWLRYTNNKKAVAATIAAAAAVIMAGIGTVIFRKRKIVSKPAQAK